MRAGKLPNFGMLAKIIDALSFIKGARWLPPSESRQDPDCAVMEFDLELEAEKVAKLGMVTMALRVFDPSVDTDHPVFAYLGNQQVKGEPSKITLTLSIKQTDKE